MIVKVVSQLNKMAYGHNLGILFERSKYQSIISKTWQYWPYIAAISVWNSARQKLVT